MLLGRNFIARMKSRLVICRGLLSSYLFKEFRKQLNITVLMYHEVLEENINYDAWTVVKKCEFRRQMEYLKNNYLVISMNDASDIMNRKGKECEHYALVTFDDGYSGNYNVVMPIMTELGLPFTVFCSTNYIERGDLYWWDKVIYSALNCRTKISLTEFFLGVYDFRKSQTAEQRWVEI